MALTKLAGLLLAVGFSAQAANVNVIPEVSPSRSRHGEPINFVVRVNSSNYPKITAPEFPESKDWKVLNTSRSTSTSMKIDSQLTPQVVVSQVYHFVLHPLRKGTLKIPQVKVKVDNELFTTESIDVVVDAVNDSPDQWQQQIAPGGRPPLPIDPFADDMDDEALFGQATGDAPEENPGGIAVPERETFFVRGEPNKTSVYQGELIVLSYNLYQGAVNLGNFQFSKFPSFKGFLKEELYQPRNMVPKQVTLNGKPYRKFELIRYALFPLKDGALKVEPFLFKADMIFSPFDSLLRRYQGGQQRPGGPIAQTKSSPAITFDVKPLPPVPADAVFDGAVGQYEMEMVGPTKPVATDQPFTVKLTLAGSGNLKAISEPNLQLPATFEPYETKPDYRLNLPEPTGYKSFEYLILPRQPGSFEIPPVKWSYFDPSKKQYVTLTSKAMQIRVEGAANATPETPAGKASAPVMGFQPLRTGPQNFVRADNVPPKTFFATSPAWALQGAAYLGFIALLLKKRKEERDAMRLLKHPWERTARTIRSKSKWGSEELSILVDQWVRERLTGFIHAEGGPEDFHVESPRSDFESTLQSLLPPDKLSAFKPLDDLWHELDELRFTGRKTKEKIAPDALFDKAKGSVESLLKKTV